jgi:hypothetical protein
MRSFANDDDDDDDDDSQRHFTFSYIRLKRQWHHNSAITYNYGKRNHIIYICSLRPHETSTPRVHSIAVRSFLTRSFVLQKRD